MISSLEERTFVSLDLETTGLDMERDEIIEIGAVKFRAGHLLDTFQTLINPARPLPHFITLLTGIAEHDLAAAPSLADVGGQLLSFVGDAAVVGQNVGFDLAFLRRVGLSFSSPVYDTLEMALVLHPCFPEHGLAALAEALGLSHDNPHRALDDARVTMEVFERLLVRIEALRPETLKAMTPLLIGRDWPFGRILLEHGRSRTGGSGEVQSMVQGVLDRMAQEETPDAIRRPKLVREEVEATRIADILGASGPLAAALETFENRPRQLAMAGEVVDALNNGGTLLIEAGAGTGKSLAYLVPALSMATLNSAPVVVSTSTRGLQEQLAGKDLPLALKALGMTGREVSVAVLKGQGNYLCLHRLVSRLQQPDLSLEEARFLLRLLVWLEESISGNQGELNLWPHEQRLWELVRAGDSQTGQRCPFRRRGMCFISRARRQAQNAHVIITNHAFLLADAAQGGAFLSHAPHLIVDEAHNLEAEATNQFGDRIVLGDVARPLDRLRVDSDDSLRLEVRSRDAVSAQDLALARLENVARLAHDVDTVATRARTGGQVLFETLHRFLNVATTGGRGDFESRVRITPTLRRLVQWGEVLRTWEDVDAALRETLRALERLRTSLEGVDDEGLLADLDAEAAALIDLSERLKAIISPSDDADVRWLTRRTSGEVTLERAPLRTGPLLQERLFASKEAVVLTSATLSVGGRFDYVKSQLGLEGAQECILGSSFDYEKAVAVFVPKDMPGPDSPSYGRAVERALAELTLASHGHALALFTSYAALRSAYASARAALEPQGIAVLAQGIDGQPARLLQAFRKDPKALLLGTGTFWEGVDLAGAALRLLVITRLPFRVPTDPVFAARSEGFDDPFNQYALPESVLRFRQGFGRLIRTRRDQGIVVVLDARVLTKSYGQAFLDALPGMSAGTPLLRDMAKEVTAWLSERS